MTLHWKCNTMRRICVKSSALLLSKTISEVPGRDFNYRAFLAAVRRANNLDMCHPTLAKFAWHRNFPTRILCTKKPTYMLNHLNQRSKSTITPFRRGELKYKIKWSTVSLIIISEVYLLFYQLWWGRNPLRLQTCPPRPVKLNYLFTMRRRWKVHVILRKLKPTFKF